MKFNEIFKKLKKEYYRGTKVYCPLCENDLSKFEQLHDLQICPLCECLPREREILSLINGSCHKNPVAILLIYTIPEYNSLATALSKRKETNLTILDYNNLNLHEKQNFKGFSGKDQSYDIIIADNFLDKVFNDQHILSEFKRVAKTDALLFLASIIDKTAIKTQEFKIFPLDTQEKLYKTPGNNRLYGLDYEERLNKFGFKISNESGSFCFINGEIDLKPQKAVESNPNDQKNYSALFHFTARIIYPILQNVISVHKRYLISSVKSSFSKELFFYLVLTTLPVIIGWTFICLIPLIGLIIGTLLMAFSLVIFYGNAVDSRQSKFKRSFFILLNILIITLITPYATNFFLQTMGAVVNEGAHNLYTPPTTTPNNRVE